MDKILFKWIRRRRTQGPHYNASTHGRICNQDGFTLVELMVAVGIMCIVLMVGTDQIVTLNNLRTMVQAKTSARMDAKLLSIYITNNLEQVGGGVIRPWMALWLENNCAARDAFPDCQGSDRITFAQVNNNFSACSIVTAVAPGTLNFDPVASPQCCAANMNGQQVTIVEGIYYAHFFITGVTYVAPPNPLAQCSITVTPGQMYGLNAVYGPPTFATFTGGSLAVENVATLYLDPVNYVVHSYQDLQNDRLMDAGDDAIIADQVVDLQFILGFDAPPQDGVITNLNSDQDEWLYNSNLPQEALGQGGLATAAMTDLRAIGVGVMTSSPGASSVAPAETQLFDGPVRSVPNYYLTTSQNRVYMRALNLINN